MYIVDVALGDTYTIILNKDGKIFMIGKMSPAREKIDYDMDYIIPLELAAESSIDEPRPHFTKIKSGRAHSLCIDHLGRIYSWGKK